MGYKIRVNHQLMRSKARELRAYGTTMYQNASRAASVSSKLRADWSGKDATVYRQKLGAIDDPNSIMMKLNQMFKNSADYLENAADSYTQAQAKAISRSQRL